MRRGWPAGTVPLPVGDRSDHRFPRTRAVSAPGVHGSRISGDHDGSGPVDLRGGPVLRDGGLRDALVHNNGLVGAIVEESLRVDPPVTTTDRIVARDAAIEDCPFREGDVLTTSLLAANHDPAVFVDPHRFDAMRAERPHLAFGAGAHICLGAPLARLEGQAAILELFTRFHDLQLLDESVQLRPVPGHRGPHRLMVRG